MKEKFSKIVDKVLEMTLRGVLAILFVFGLFQFIYMAMATLFGMEYGWLQYIASIVLFIGSLVSAKLLINLGA